MQPEDLIIISVDDHVVEPPDIFENHLPVKYRDIAPSRAPARRKRPVVILRHQHSERGPERRRRTTQGGVRARAHVFRRASPGLLRRARAGEGHERGRRAGVAQLPVDGRLRGPAVRPARGQGAALAFCGPTTTGTSRTGAAPTRALHPAVDHAAVGPAAGGPGDPSSRGEGVPRGELRGEPGAVGFPSLHSDHWDPFWQACADEAVIICMHIGSSSKLPARPRRADRRRHHAHAAQQPAGGRGHHLLADVQKFPDLKVSLSEGGIGWVPYFLERLTTATGTTGRGPERTSAVACPRRCSSTTCCCAISPMPSG